MLNLIDAEKQDVLYHENREKSSDLLLGMYKHVCFGKASTCSWFVRIFTEGSSRVQMDHVQLGPSAIRPFQLGPIVMHTQPPLKPIITIHFR